MEFLSASALDDEILRALIYPRTEQTLYWCDSWDPELYVSLARAGFICISIQHPDIGPVLLAELQRSYAVLDWENLHCSRNLRRLVARGRLEEEAVELRVASASDRVLDRLLDYHGEDGWIHEPYQSLVRELARSGGSHFSVHGIELWSRRSEELVAGELGYSIGSTYTSLSGFCMRTQRRWRHFGTLQQILLARALRERGYAFWNMGHVAMPYKQALGARSVPRATFLERWCAARDVTPAVPLLEGDSLCDYTQQFTQSVVDPSKS